MALTQKLCLSRLTSLRLEGSWATDVMTDHDVLLGSISSLTALEELHIGCFIGGLGHMGHPADVAAALQPLHRLRALVRGHQMLAGQLEMTVPICTGYGSRPSAWPTGVHASLLQLDAALQTDAHIE
jgi:hypothetical protein